MLNLFLASEAINTGIQVVVLGTIIVVGMLGVLVGVLNLLKLTQKVPKKQPKQKQLKGNDAVALQAPSDTSNEDENIIAVITAAVYAMMQSQGGDETADVDFVVRSIRRI